MAPFDHFLTIDRVSKVFNGERGSAPVPVVDTVSLTVEENEFIVFLGPSGCGKTTLMRCVGGLETPSSGRIVLEGEPVTGPDRKKGMVFQSYSSFPWLTVLENVEFGLRFRPGVSAAEKRDIARHYLNVVNLSGYEDFYTNRISGGMRQRVAIARTLAADPDILLMDEPFGALDAQNREMLQEQLLKIRETERKTVIFVTHDVEEGIFLADRIIIFSARPASVIADIDVRERLPDRTHTLETKETEGFWHLRNEVLHITREEARRASAMMEAAS